MESECGPGWKQAERPGGEMEACPLVSGPVVLTPCIEARIAVTGQGKFKSI